MDFDGQRSGEEVLYVFRRHISTARKGLYFLIFMILLGLVPRFLWPGNDGVSFVGLACVLVGVLGFGYSLLLWYFSFYMLTSERLRQTRQKGIFKKTVVDLDLENILSVSYGIPGIFGSMMNYGTIMVQTSAGDLVLSMVTNPEEVYNELQNAAHAVGREE